ncbi:MAG: hypothetical protein A2W19_09350 [Spirochaetes bacterium RBG_16_49_21]|nr:MAG: hypothetical protein A2W19_09350 [Spirochaetes bacterium RBG_16_49_21]
MHHFGRIGIKPLFDFFGIEAYRAAALDKGDRAVHYIPSQFVFRYAKITCQIGISPEGGFIYYLLLHYGLHDLSIMKIK